MPDLRFDRSVRSRNMSAIRSKDTAVELQVRRSLHAAGFRFRLHRKDLPGKPDIVLPRYRTVVFVDGCFWHGHDCREGHTPRSNLAYWGPKIARNVERDASSRAALNILGWRVIIVHECAVTQDTAALLVQLDQTTSRASSLPDQDTSE